MTLLEFARGPALTWAFFIFVAGVLWRIVGVLLLRTDQDGIRPIVDLIDKVLQSYDLNALVGTTTVVTPRGVRVRKSV